MLQIASIASGSNGNCYYVGNCQEAVLIDAGISCREISRRMERIGLSLTKVKAIFVSHEHSDHIRGLTLLSRKYRIPVYITPLTQRNGRLGLEPGLTLPLQAGSTVSIGGLHIRSFKKFHDAAEPCSFLVSGEGVEVGVITDIGRACPEVIAGFSRCAAVFLESNYDEGMLEAGFYPEHLKRRIRGGWGHISNREALELFRRHRSPHLSHLLLSHLSKNNNCPELVHSLFAPHAGATRVVVASRYEPSEVFSVSGRVAAGTAPADLSGRPEQLALFG